MEVIVYLRKLRLRNVSKYLYFILKDANFIVSVLVSYTSIQI